MGGISTPRLGRRLDPGLYAPADAPRSPCRCAPCTSRTRPSAGLQSPAGVDRPTFPHPRGTHAPPPGSPSAVG
eukprot:603290-Prorocentrum_minimum.AAC.1